MKTQRWTHLVLAALTGLLAAGCGGQKGPRPSAQADAAMRAEPHADPAAGAGAGAGAQYRGTVARSALRERALDLLTQAAVSNNALLRANAIEGLQAAPTRAEDAVRAGLADENPGVRFAAAKTVGQLKLKRSAPFVEPLLADPDPRVRAAAIFALRSLGANTDPTPLGDMLLNDDPLIRAEAARTLGELRQPSAVPMLKAAAAHADRRSRALSGDPRAYQLERIFQLQVAEALHRLGEPGASDALRAALYPASPEGFESAALAAHILGTLREQRAIGQLVEIIEQRVPGAPPPRDPRDGQYVQPKEVRLAAAWALARMGYLGGLYVADSYFEDPEPAVRAQAVTVFGAAGRTADLARLERAMEDANPMVQVAAAAATLRALEDRR